MKIYRIPVEDVFRPNHQDFIWPPQNSQAGFDKGVEQDFDEWLLLQPDMLVDDPVDADWMYVPIFWNRYYINNDWGESGRERLAEEVCRVLSLEMPTFTISEADIKWLKHYIDWRGMIIFCSSRRDENGGIDIPLLSAPHPTPENLPRKKWLASFMGNMQTDGVRIDMGEAIKHRRDCRVEHSNVPPEEFTRVMLESYIALCPRGQGAQSYRMYEAMQLGVVPLYISDMDCRPFNRWIDWASCSLWLNDVYYLDDLLSECNNNKPLLLGMGERAQRIYSDYLYYGRWCEFVLKELELL